MQTVAGRNFSIYGSARSLRRANANSLALEDDLKYSKMKWTFLVLSLAAIVVVGGCKKKQVPPAPPAAPPPPQPRATLSVSPESIDRGGSATLTWSTQDATSVNIDGVGNAQLNGSQQVSRPPPPPTTSPRRVPADRLTQLLDSPSCRLRLPHSRPPCQKRAKTLCLRSP